MSVESPSVTIPARHRTGVSVASLVCAVVALVVSPLWMFSFPLALVAIVLGAIGWWATTREPERQGRYQAMGGVAVGAIAIVIGIISLVWWIKPSELGDDCQQVGNVTACYSSDY
jgi:hypothetical protein